MMIRHGIATVFLAVAGICSLPLPSHAQATVGTAEKRAVEFFSVRGIKRLLILNKQTSTLTRIDNGEVTFKVPALIGRKISDDFNSNLGSTAAGVFLLEKGGTTISPYAVFYRDGILDYSIHPIPNVPGQNRDKRILASNPSQKRITSGCINLSEDDVWKVIDFMNGEQQTLNVDEGKVAQGSFLVVLAENFGKPQYKQGQTYKLITSADKSFDIK